MLIFFLICFCFRGKDIGKVERKQASSSKIKPRGKILLKLSVIYFGVAFLEVSLL